jgi:nitroreductase
MSAVEVRRLLTGRRSVRHYRSGGLDHDLLQDVLSVGSYSATASNARDVEAIVLQGQPLLAVATAVNDYYARLVRWLENPWLRGLLWLTPVRPYLKQPKMLAHMRDCVRSFGPGHDWVFFDAPAVVVLTTPRRNRRFGRVNATIAAEQMQTYAASLGLGSCWIGYAEVVLKASRATAELAGVARDREPQAVFTLGRPSVSFQRLPPRAPFPVVWRGD